MEVFIPDLISSPGTFSLLAKPAGLKNLGERGEAVRSPDKLAIRTRRSRSENLDSFGML